MASSKTRTIFAALMLAALVGYSRPHAASRLTEDLTELLQCAEAVVEVTVLDKKVQPTSALELPVTLATVQVRKVYKGSLNENVRLTVEYFGGFDGKNEVVVPAQPELNAGDRAVLLLIQARKPDGNWRILSGDTGQINLKAVDGGVLAERQHGKFTYYVGNKSSSGSYKSAASTALSAGDLDRLLHATLDTGCPVLEGGAPTDATPSASAPCRNPLPPQSHADEAVPTVADSPSVSFRILIVLAAMTVVYLIFRRAR